MNRRTPRILVEPNAHHLLNLGDVAMLQVAVERLATLMPGASIQVITESPERLARFCPAAEPLDVAGRRLWFDDYLSTYTLHRLMPARLSRGLLERERAVRRGSPRTALRFIRARSALRRLSTKPLADFLAAVEAADVVISTGAGAFTDYFSPLAVTILELLETAKGIGAVTALLGHGIGPIEDRSLVERAREVLPTVDLITIRESVLSAPVLEALGVKPDKIITTGDDAVELAYRAATPHSRSWLGFNLRLARYAGVDALAAETVGAAVRDACERHRVQAVIVPISRHPTENDAAVSSRLLGTGVTEQQPVETPTDVVDVIGGCRIVVTGSYHAAVFALGQGIPAIGLTQSGYYDAKFRGLNEQFGGALPVITLADHDLRRRLSESIDDVWERADELRPLLLERASLQVERGNAAYRRLHDLVATLPGA